MEGSEQIVQTNEEIKQQSKLLINKSFMGKTSCFKVQLAESNSKKECYIHTGKQDKTCWIWGKAKFNTEEIAQLILFLNNNEKTVKFFHKFKNNKGVQIYFNKDEKYIFPIINKIAGKSLTKAEQLVLRILLQKVIEKMVVE